MIKTLFRILTPFITIVADSINGVLLYRQYELNVGIYDDIYPVFNHLTGSSILLMSYVISTSNHMCIYYKMSCYTLIVMHLFSILYVYTNISVIEYVYYAWVLLSISFVMWLVAVLGHKTCKTIDSACKHSKTQ